MIEFEKEKNNYKKYLTFNILPAILNKLKSQ